MLDFKTSVSVKFVHFSKDVSLPWQKSTGKYSLTLSAENDVDEPLESGPCSSHLGRHTGAEAEAERNPALMSLLL